MDIALLTKCIMNACKRHKGDALAAHFIAGVTFAFVANQNVSVIKVHNWVYM